MESAHHDDLGILLAIVHVGWADGRLTAEELELLRAEIDDQGLDEAERMLVAQALMDPPDVERVASYLSSEEARLAALSAAYVTAYADETVALSEIESCRALGTAFGLSAAQQQEVRKFAERQAWSVREQDWEHAMYLENFLSADEEPPPE